jgi:membrane-associated phospholipid phosphatase
VTSSRGLRSRVGEIDGAVDKWWDEHLRGRLWIDRLMYAATAAGDQGAIWMLLAAIQAGLGRQGGQRVARVTLLLGVESLVVNGPIKWIFRRSRPAQDVAHPHWLRRPRSSSFPSGHAAAGFFGAAILRDGDNAWPLYYALAAIVAASRVHVRIHHASDVVAGAALGVVLGKMARPLARPPKPAG